ncbi:MAG: hypothetical protein DMG55_33055 [Acidobacteria bacterium]|nr:MAG: hypothetical protein DMG55_33055 [Acidobacteriota bacterium]
MIDSLRTDLGLDDLADGEAGESYRQIFSPMVRAKSMNRIFHELRAAFGRAWRLNLEGHSRKLFTLVCGLAVMIVAPAVRAQKLPTPPPNGRRASNIAKSVLTAAASAPLLQEPISPQVPLPLTAEQGTPSRQQVSYEDGQLTIIAENSKLGEILAAVSERLGANIELPASSSDERIWVRAGPGPARRVLAALLSGTDLDYVIQASDTDPEGILSVLLTPRTRAAGAVTTGRPASPAEPAQARGASRRNPQANRGPVEAPSLENSTEPASPVEVPLAGSPPASAEQQPASAELQAVPDTSEADADKSVVKSPEQMIQKLQNMYQQRKQMQQDRNKPPTPN